MVIITFARFGHKVNIAEPFKNCGIWISHWVSLLMGPIGPIACAGVI